LTTRDPIFTVGHSTRSIEEFVQLLQAGGVRLVVDIRTIPRSRTNPQYNMDALPDALRTFEIGYSRIAELGGFKKNSTDVAPQTNAYWENKSFHNYADYALSDAFRAGLNHLLEASEHTRTAIMCSEAVWWRCHRRIVADYLMRAGREVYHLMGGHDVKPATPTPAAVNHSDGIHYPTL
jgi:uncharacterized protein (DUF488 family)